MTRRCLKRRIKVEDFGLEHPQPMLFASCQWQCHPSIFLLWRAVSMTYFVVWIILSATWDYDWFTTTDNRLKWFVYMTNWALLLLTLSTIMQAFVVGLAYSKQLAEGQRHVFPSMSWYLRADWFLYNISVCSAILVTFSYWIFIYYPGKEVHPVDFVAHATNSIYVVLDFCVTSIPVRLHHVIHGLIFTGTYAIFSIIYYTAGGTNALDKPYIYSAFDWEKPKSAAIYTILFVLSPFVVWFCVCGMHWIRTLLCRRCYDQQETVYKVERRKVLWDTYGSSMTSEANEYEV